MLSLHLITCIEDEDEGSEVKWSEVENKVYREGEAITLITSKLFWIESSVFIILEY